MKQVSVILIFLACSFSINCNCQDTSSCLGLIRKILSLQNSARSDHPPFNYLRFRSQTEKYREMLSAGQISIENYEVQSPEDFLALFEAYAFKTKNDFIGLSTLPQGNLKAKEQKIIEMTENQIRSGPSSRKEFQTFVENLYTLYLTPENNLFKRNFIRWQNSFRLREMIRQRIGLSFVRQSMEEALTEVGVIRNPNTLETFRVWRKLHYNIEQTFITTALNAVSLFYAGIPIHFPQYKLLSNTKLTQELIELIRSRGFDAAYEVLVHQYGNRAKFDWAFSRAQEIFAASILTYVGYFICDNYQSIAFTIG